MSKPRLIPFDSARAVAKAIPAVATHLQRGGLLAYPTETVYGVGGAVHAHAIEGVLALKGREANRPMLMLVDGLHMVQRLGLALTPAAQTLAHAFWPGPLTLVLPVASPHATFHPALMGPDGGVAVRWTSHAGLQALLTAYGAPITSTSANPAGERPAATATEVAARWPSAFEAGTLQILDGGTRPAMAPSTVVNCITEAPHVLRAGALAIDELRRIVPSLLSDSAS